MDRLTKWNRLSLCLGFLLAYGTQTLATETLFLNRLKAGQIACQPSVYYWNFFNGWSAKDPKKTTHEVVSMNITRFQNNGAQEIKTLETMQITQPFKIELAAYSDGENLNVTASVYEDDDNGRSVFIKGATEETRKIYDHSEGIVRLNVVLTNPKFDDFRHIKGVHMAQAAYQRTFGGGNNGYMMEWDYVSFSCFARKL